MDSYPDAFYFLCKNEDPYSAKNKPKDRHFLYF